MACSLAQVRALIDAFLAVDEQRRGLVRGIVTERAWQFEMVQAVCGPEGIRLFLAGSPRSGNPLLSKWSFLIRPTFQLDGARLMQDDSRAVQAAAAPTWPQADCLLSRRFRKRRDGFKLASQLLSAFMWYDFSYPLKESYETIAKRRMAATALAIRLYVADHGTMPRTLEELVPRYLSEVPRDLCTVDRPIEYGQFNGVPYLLSVGCVETGGSVTPVRFWLGPKPAKGPQAGSNPAD